jgi:DNA-directed RNA polymerase subunit RPC12/RpoP
MSVKKMLENRYFELSKIDAMQEEIQCPNCRSFYTKTRTRQFRLGMTLIFALLGIWCLFSTISEFSGGAVLFGLIFLMIGLGYGVNYFLIKGDSSHCKACNHKWIH